MLATTSVIEDDHRVDALHEVTAKLLRHLAGGQRRLDGQGRGPEQRRQAEGVEHEVVEGGCRAPREAPQPGKERCANQQETHQGQRERERDPPRRRKPEVQVGEAHAAGLTGGAGVEAAAYVDRSDRVSSTP
jgi:hypothetical protein